MKDLFSDHAPQYAQFRPVYPSELYAFIFGLVKNFGCAWDAGTGNGQAAQELATRFQRVHATDISSGQLAQAVKRDNIYYALAAEVIEQPAHSVDLITVAQAIHWFDIPKFFECVKKVGKPDGLLAVWGYGLLRINPKADAILDDFYYRVVGPHWDPERRMIDDHYRSVPFPFQELTAPSFSFSVRWSQQQLQGYLNTWSAVQKYIGVHQANPVTDLMLRLQPHIPDEVAVTFPLFLRTGRMG